MKKTIFLAILLSISSLLNAQNYVSLKFFGLSYHPFGEAANADLMPNKLDKDAYFVVNYGFIFSYEHYVYSDKVSIKYVQSIYSDCAERFAGFVHIGIRFRVIHYKKNYINTGIGPSIAFRRSWTELENYVNQNLFSISPDGRWQYIFIWYGGDIEYHHNINKKSEFIINIIPGYPHVISLSAGISHRF